MAQLPRSMAFGNDGNTLYVASGGGEQISIVDLAQGKVTGRVLFPPLPFNATFGVITPALLAGSQRGPQVIMSDGTLWKIVGDKVTPRPLNTNIFGTARSHARAADHGIDARGRLRADSGGQRHGVSV